ncbi:hypothetical protein F4776DRAFT_641952 [Hypoxylon sp. NC0597]|nr:hypothetical protein F4776DRAFT_641952 [Hypoxylon sp. NC0597]
MGEPDTTYVEALYIPTEEPVTTMEGITTEPFVHTEEVPPHIEEPTTAVGTPIIATEARPVAMEEPGTVVGEPMTGVEESYPGERELTALIREEIIALGGVIKGEVNPMAEPSRIVEQPTVNSEFQVSLDPVYQLPTEEEIDKILGSLPNTLDFIQQPSDPQPVSVSHEQPIYDFSHQQTLSQEPTMNEDPVMNEEPETNEESMVDEEPAINEATDSDMTTAPPIQEPPDSPNENIPASSEDVTMGELFTVCNDEQLAKFNEWAKGYYGPGIGSPEQDAEDAPIDVDNDDDAMEFSDSEQQMPTQQPSFVLSEQPILDHNLPTEHAEDIDMNESNIPSNLPPTPSSLWETPATLKLSSLPHTPQPDTDMLDTQAVPPPLPTPEPDADMPDSPAITTSLPPTIPSVDPSAAPEMPVDHELDLDPQGDHSSLPPTTEHDTAMVGVPSTHSPPPEPPVSDADMADRSSILSSFPSTSSLSTLSTPLPQAPAFSSIPPSFLLPCKPREQPKPLVLKEKTQTQRSKEVMGRGGKELAMHVAAIKQAQDEKAERENDDSGDEERVRKKSSNREWSSADDDKMNEQMKKIGDLSSKSQEGMDKDTTTIDAEEKKRRDEMARKKYEADLAAFKRRQKKPPSLFIPRKKPAPKK